MLQWQFHLSLIFAEQFLLIPLARHQNKPFNKNWAKLPKQHITVDDDFRLRGGRFLCFMLIVSDGQLFKKSWIKNF